MSMLPPRMPGDLERSLWGIVPTEKRGKVTTREEIDKFAAEKKDTIEEIRKRGAYTVFGFSKFRLLVAYDCGNCKNVIYGPPRIVDDTSIDDGYPLSGREGYDMYCTNCGKHLDGVTLKVS